jgi:hypothetical protein
MQLLMAASLVTVWLYTWGNRQVARDMTRRAAMPVFEKEMVNYSRKYIATLGDDLGSNHILVSFSYVLSSSKGLALQKLVF